MGKVLKVAAYHVDKLTLLIMWWLISTLSNNHCEGNPIPNLQLSMTHSQNLHISGECTVRDDKTTDHTDLRLNLAIFRRIDNLLGTIEVDLFASRLTAQCPAYFSWRPDPYALATDALVQDQQFGTMNML